MIYGRKKRVFEKKKQADFVSTYSFTAVVQCPRNASSAGSTRHHIYENLGNNERAECPLKM